MPFALVLWQEGLAPGLALLSFPLCRVLSWGWIDNLLVYGDFFLPESENYKQDGLSHTVFLIPHLYFLRTLPFPNGEHPGGNSCCGSNCQVPGDVDFSVFEMLCLQNVTPSLSLSWSFIRPTRWMKGSIRSAFFPFDSWCPSVTFSCLERVLCSH